VRLLHVIGAADVAARQAETVAIDAAEGEFRALPADEFVQVQVQAEVGVIGEPHPSRDHLARGGDDFAFAFQRFAEQGVSCN